MLDAKEGDHLALPMGDFSPPKKLTVCTVRARYVSTDDGDWNRETRRRWGAGNGRDRDRVEPWSPHHDLLVEAFKARVLVHRMGEVIRENRPIIGAAIALPHLRAAAKALGLEIDE